jgi:D-alanyl-lipoteichoic acid acyltransferase DltB (MBOAT superfamily)
VSTSPHVANVAAGRPAAGAETLAKGIGSHLFVLGQLALTAWVVQLYAIEGAAFFRLFVLAVAGFAVNLVLPLAWRLRFFVGLSLAGAVVVFGVSDAAWMIAVGLVLIGLCHLPCSLRLRSLLLVVVGGALAASRGGLMAAPWSAVVWPILGSMFMFRLALYLLATKHGRPENGGIWSALAYFFMLPNLVFPLYPVVDYQTFSRNYYDKDEKSIYEQGLQWIVRGTVHLLLYRLVYHSILNDPSDVLRFGDLVRFMVATFLLYLKVSGQFHLIVGLLHLFGFRLPETHKLYYLAHSFTDLWRRINIYWTDFMMKTVFYPTYFKVKRFGPIRGLVISTSAVFAVTWILHSYQWFWLRGGFPLTLQDTLFWGALGVLVIAGGLREARAGKKPRQGVTTWSWRLGLRSVATFSLFCFLWSLWSTDSVAQWVWMLGSAGNVDLEGIALLALVLLIVMAFGGRDWEAARSSGGKWIARVPAPTTRTLATLVVLLVIGQPALQQSAPTLLAGGLSSLKSTGLNARDQAIQHRGYYEQLDVRAQLTAEVLNVATPRADWANLAGTGMLKGRQDAMLRELWPSRSVLWNGLRFTTNRWGMRDQDYERAKPQGTLRIALLGPSHVMGNGVADGETFEALVEKRLNERLPNDRYQRIEILNFGVDGYSLPQQIAMLEERVFVFSPDIVIATHYTSNRTMTEGYLRRVAEDSIAVPIEQEQFLSSAGLVMLPHGQVAVPFASGRRLAIWLGIDARMPESEMTARARWIADDVVNSTFRRFAKVTRDRGVVPMVLALNVVIDDEPRTIPNRAVLDELALPVLDLFAIFPPEQRTALRVAPWDDHPNAAAHQLIADRMYEQLVRWLETSHQPTMRSASQDARLGGPSR